MSRLPRWPWLGAAMAAAAPIAVATRSGVAALLTIAALSVAAPADAQTAASAPQASAARGGSEAPFWTSKSGAFRLRYESRLMPIVINRMHAWQLHLETAGGEPVTGAQFTVSGGMPAHDHGLPTAPRVTRELGNGDYLLEGVRFHMNGDWEITFAFTANGVSDVVVVPLTL